MKFCFIVWYIHWPKRLAYLFDRNCSCFLDKCEGKLNPKITVPKFTSSPGACAWNTLVLREMLALSNGGTLHLWRPLKMCSERGAAFPEVSVPFKVTEIQLRSLRNGSLIGERSNSQRSNPMIRTQCEMKCFTCQGGLAMVPKDLTEEVSKRIWIFLNFLEGLSPTLHHNWEKSPTRELTFTKWMNLLWVTPLV